MSSKYIKSKQEPSKAPAQKYTTSEALVNYYIALMFSVFPLFFTDAYFNIRHDKYGLFLGLSLVLIVAEGALIAYAYFVPDNPDDKIAGSAQQWYKRFSVTDFAVIGFVLLNLISTLLSEYKLDSLLGTVGRNNGLLLTAVYAGVYFIITRLLNYREYIFVFLAAGSIIVFLLAVLNCFYIDPLGMFERLTDEQTITDFTSTLGNKNFMSSYICIVLPILTALSVLTKKSSLRILYLAASGCGFAALMTSDSDSGILGMAAFVMIYFIWFVRDIFRLKRYFLSLCIMLISAKLLRLFSYFMNDNSKGMESFQKLFVYSNSGWIMLSVCAIITALLYFVDRKKTGIVLPKTVPVAIAVAIVAGVMGLLGIMLYFSVFNTSADLGSFEKLIRFNDSWGTHRGFMWIRSFEILGNELKNGEIAKFLFGTGPDTFYYAFAPYFNDLLKYGDSSTNAAHNEYINYLVTTGITGFAAYAALVGGVITRAVKYAKKNPVIMVCAAGVICYSVQAVVNIAQPITTPLFIIMLSLTEAFARKTKNKN